MHKSWAYSAFRNFVLKTQATEHWKNHWQRIVPGDSVLDIGCGTGESLETMPEISYLGLDYNAGYVERARGRYGSRGEFRVFDISHDVLAESNRFDLVLCYGVLHHLTDGQVAKLMETAHRAMKPTGRLLTLDGVYHEGQPLLSRWMVSRDRGRFVREEKEYLRLAGLHFTNVRHELMQNMLRIPFSHIVMECRR